MSSIQDTDIRFKLIRKHIVDARIKEQEKQKCLFGIFDHLLYLGIHNPNDIPSDAENADNLSDAITCYIDYGEYDIQKIMDEIEKAYYTIGEGKDENNN